MGRRRRWPGVRRALASPESTRRRLCREPGDPQTAKAARARNRAASLRCGLDGRGWREAGERRFRTARRHTCADSPPAGSPSHAWRGRPPVSEPRGPTPVAGTAGKSADTSIRARTTSLWKYTDQRAAPARDRVGDQRDRVRLVHDGDVGRGAGQLEGQRGRQPDAADAGQRRGSRDRNTAADLTRVRAQVLTTSTRESTSRRSDSQSNCSTRSMPPGTGG